MEIVLRKEPEQIELHNYTSSDGSIIIALKNRNLFLLTRTENLHKITRYVWRSFYQGAIVTRFTSQGSIDRCIANALAKGFQVFSFRNRKELGQFLTENG